MDRCPPHDFRSAMAWDGEQSSGYIFCRLCGDVRPLAPQLAEAPAEERVTAKEDEKRG